MNNEKEYIIENLAILVDSGIDIISSLHAILEESTDKSTKKMIQSIIEKIENGTPLWKAVEDLRLLPMTAISLIRSGETSGKLPENLNLIAEQSHRNRQFRSKIFSAMMYPAIVLTLTVTIGSGIALFLLPRLAGIFKNLKIKLPLITQIFISIGNFLDQYGIIVVPIFLILLSISIYFIFFYPKTKFIGFYILFGIPQLRKLIQEVELAHTGYILGTSLDAGLPLTETLKAVSTATSLSFYQKLYIHLQNSIEEGNSFQKSFLTFPNSSKLIPHVVQEMIVSGEKSGNLEEVFMKIAKNFEEKTEASAKNLTTLMEPILLIIIWMGVMMVALAVILPIYSLIGNINQS